MVHMIQKERMKSLLDQVIDLDEEAREESQSVENYQIEAERAYRREIHQLEIDGMHRLKQRRDALKQEIMEERDAALLAIEKEKREALERIEGLMQGDRSDLVDRLVGQLFGSDPRG